MHGIPHNARDSKVSKIVILIAFCELVRLGPHTMSMHNQIKQRVSSTPTELVPFSKRYSH